LYCLLEEIPKLKTDSDTEVTKLTYFFIICCCSDVTLCYHGYRFSNQTSSHQCHGNASIAKAIGIAIAILFKFCIGIAIAITFAASIVIVIAIHFPSIANNPDGFSIDDQHVSNFLNTVLECRCLLMFETLGA
jgi:hypothetical protein